MIRFRWLCCLAVIWASSPAAAPAPVILVLGDSLSAAHGIADREGWVSLLAHKLDDNGYPHEVVNASISGDTTQDALSRLEPTLERHHPNIVVVELGGNDGLRAFSVETVQRNLESILNTIRESGAKIVLAGIRMPPNYGPAYTRAFEAVYPRLADEFNAALIPFFMEGVATDPELMQDDGIHPNAAAQPRLLDNVWRVLKPLLEKNRDS